LKIALITPHKKLDALAPLIIEGLYDHEVIIVASDFGNGIKPEDVRSRLSFVKFAKKADFIFVIWGKGPDIRWPKHYSNRHPKYYLLNFINRPDRTVFIDGSEWTSSGYPENIKRIPAPFLGNKKIPKQIMEAKIDPYRCRGEPWINIKMQKKCRWYFKRECYEQDLDYGIIPLYIGCMKKYFGDFSGQKKTDIILSFGQIETGLRFEVQTICLKLKHEGYNVKIIKGLDYQQYLNELSKSYISVSSWGAGNSCMRMWESMANKTCCFVQKPEIIITNKPQDGLHDVEYSTTVEFETKIREYLNNKKKCIQIGLDGYNFVKNNHVGASRIKYILNIINSS
jgi:hypothetical protein